MRKPLVFLWVLFLGLGCGDDATGPAFPNLRGNYTASWRFTFTEVSTGQSESSSCPGSVAITQQNEGQFSGSFVIQETDECETASGTLNGQIRQDGGLNFRIDVPGADPNEFENLTGCDVVSSDDQFNGVFAGNQISASASATIRCAVPGVGILTLRLRIEITANKI